MRKTRHVGDNSRDRVSPSVDLRLERLRAEFEASKNPLVLWEAYRFARIVHLRAPEWVSPEWIFQGLDDVAERLLKLTFDDERSGETHWLRALAGAFGFAVQNGGGASDPFLARQRGLDHLELAVRVRILVDGDGHNETDACYLVSQQRGVSQATVSRAWKKFESAARIEDVEVQRGSLAVLDEQCRIAELIGRASDQELH